MKTAVIISGGKIQSDFALAFLKDTPCDFVIGADRGIVFCREHQIQPTHIVGDFDSAGEKELQWFLQFPEIPVRRFNPVKDFTDTDLALELALELGSDCIYILGGIGSRLDHVMANIRILSKALKAGVQAFLMDANNRIRLIDRPMVLKKNEQFGTYVSLFAFGGTVKDLTLEGFYYPLNHYRMEAGDPVGVSNELAEETGKIIFSEGSLLVFESKDD